MFIIRLLYYQIGAKMKSNLFMLMIFIILMQVISMQAADPQQHIQMVQPQQFEPSTADIINPQRLGFSQKALNLIHYIDVGDIENDPLDIDLFKQIQKIHAEIEKQFPQKARIFAAVIAYRIFRQNPQRYSPSNLKHRYETWAKNQLEKKSLQMIPDYTRRKFKRLKTSY